MQTKREQLQQELTLPPPLETLIPEDHYLRRLNQVLDLSFVHEAVRDRYCADNGRPSVDPEVVLRLFILQALTGISSVRELMREVQLHLGYRWFIGYRLDEKRPDHSTLSRALDRFGDEVFNRLFAHSIAQCQPSGLIEGKVLHVDATTIRADLSCARARQENAPDADARFGRFADGTKQPGYKQHMVADDQSRVVLSVAVTPANVNESGELPRVLDEATTHLPAPPEAVCADTAYAGGTNAAVCEARGVHLISPPAPPRCVNVGEHHGALVRLRAASRTHEFKMLYRRQSPVIEGLFAEGKQWHGLRRAWRRGLRKMRVQCLLIAAVINFKRLITLPPLWNGSNNPFLRVMACLRRAISLMTSRKLPNYGLAPKG